jgi:iron complex outermembrane receptor protein
MGASTSHLGAGRAWRLRGATALASLVLAPVLAAAAPALAAETPAELEQVVVTGTSIRGVAPVGANVIVLDQAQIRRAGAQTVQQLLTTVPQITGFNNYGQGSFGSADPAGTHAPTLHSLGASASNGTLILVDGHRLPLAGFNHTLADPNLIPPAAVERVEVLPDGASAVYGSDAVAGVINFITRRRFNGVEASGQAGFGDQYSTANANLVAGRTWDRGSAMLAYGYSYRSNLVNGDRDFYRTDLRSLGGSNYNTFACAPAAVQPGASGGTSLFLAPYTGAAVSSANPPCSYTYDIDTLPEETRHNLMARFEQRIGERLTLSGDLVYSHRKDFQEIAVGGVSNIVVYGPGSTAPGGPGQVNPFFTGPAGTSVERVSFAADELFPNAVNRAGAKTGYAALRGDYDLGHDWNAQLSGLWGEDRSFSRNYGVLCASCLILGLNGTTNVAGNPATPTFPARTGASAFVTGLPLTAANAVDVWNPRATNRTSAAALAGLLDDNDNSSRQTLGNLKLMVGGPAFAAPGGPVRVSVGAEGLRYTLKQHMVATANGGPITLNAITTDLSYTRGVYAVFGETVVPLVGEANAMAGVRRLELSGAVRYDHYDDFGGTTNPKLAAEWEPAEGLVFRGSWGTSFTAPALTSRGDDAFGVTTDSNFGASGQQVLPGAFPGANTLPGCAAVTAATSCAIGGTNPAQGIQLNGGNAALRPQTGDTWSVGADWRPSFLKGFRVSLTYWAVKYKGLIAAPSFSQVVASPGLYDALILNPTAAQVAAATAGLRQTTALPTNIAFIYSFQQRNVSNLDASGLDLDARYAFPTGFGDWTLGAAVSDKLKFAQQYGAGTPYLSRLNTAGINATFSSIRLTGRGMVGWSLANWNGVVFVNHTGGYWNRTSAAIAVSGARGQRIASYTTVDGHLSYDIQARGWLADTQVFVDGKNIFNQDPPFANVPGGYNLQDANPIGRVVSFGVRKAW